MTALKTLLRGLGFTGKAIVATLAMLVVGLAQVPAVLWYVTAATPACELPVSGAQTLTTQVGLVGLGLASATLAVLLGARFLRLRWGWLLWWVVVVLAVAAPAATLYMLPTLSPGTGGLFCH